MASVHSRQPAAGQPRARLSPADRHAQLLEIGVRLFAERSYDDFSMEEVAAEAGVSKGLVYHYFPTKRDLYMAALRDAIREMLRLTEPVASAAPEERLRRGLDAYLGYVEEHAAAYRAVLRGGIGVDPEVQAIADGFRVATFERLLEGSGLDAPGAAVRLAVRGWVGLVEAASLAWMDSRELSRPAVIDLLVEIFQATLTVATADPERQG